MTVEEVIAGFLQGNAGQTQNVRSYGKAHAGARYVVLATYGEPIGARVDSTGRLFIDDKSKYTPTSGKHRNTMIALAKALDLEWTRVSREELRKMLGYDPSKHFTQADKLPFRGPNWSEKGSPRADMDGPQATPEARPEKREKMILDDPVAYLIPIVEEHHTVITLKDLDDPDEAVEKVLEGAGSLMGADVVVVEQLHKLQHATVTVLDDDGNRVIAEGKGLGVGAGALGGAMDGLLRLLKGMSFKVNREVRETLEQTDAEVVSVLASGDVQLFASGKK
jgi:hypothetical protein